MIVILFIILALIIPLFIYILYTNKEKYSLSNLIKHKNIKKFDIDEQGLVDVNLVNQGEDEDEFPFIDSVNTNSLKYNDKRYVKTHRQRNSYNSNVFNNKNIPKN